MSASAIELRDMNVLRGRTPAVHNVSMTVSQGSWFGVIGANGSGKTSLLRALAGRLPGTAAECRIHGVELADRPEDRAQLLGFMPPGHLLPSALTCRQLFGLVQPDEDRWRRGIEPVAEAIGLDRLLDRKIGECSAGMRQRIAVACAFATGNPTIILDEPFNWLDPVAALDLREALRQSVDRGGLTLVTALHDMLTLIACDSGILLGQGRVVARLESSDIIQGRQDPFAFETRIIGMLRQHSQFS
jgi:ABC-type multidrug transport system ATPase subunit